MKVSNKKKISIFFLLFALITAGIFYYDKKISTKFADKGELTEEIDSIRQLYNSKPETTIPTEPINDQDDDTPVIEIGTDPIEAGSDHTFERTAWIPSWGHSSGVASLQRNTSLFSSISPVWYSPIPDGSLDIKKPTDWQSFLEYARSNDIKVIPSIAMFDAEVLTEILNNNNNFSRHLISIINEAITNSYDGIDIDYEMIFLKDKERFHTFINELSKRLHKEGMVLSVTILPQWGDNIVYPSLRETRAVQDLSVLAEYADQIRLMTYDYTPSNSPTPGPIAPIDWVENVLKYTTEKISSDKIWLGIHLYGYEWVSSGGVSATTFSDIADLQNIDDFNAVHNYTYNEGTATYSCGQLSTCTLFYQDIDGLLAREELARKYKLQGVAYWRLGGDANLLDNLLSD